MFKRMWLSETEATATIECAVHSKEQLIKARYSPVLVMSVEKARELFGAGVWVGDESEQRSADAVFNEWLANELKENNGK